MFELINNLALVIGYVILSLIGLIILSRFIWTGVSIGLWRNRSDEAKQIGAKIQREHGHDAGVSAWFVDMVAEEIENIGPDSHLEYEPSPVAQLDWSIDNPHSTDLNVMKSALTDAGFYVHPFPREREGEWSNRYAGVWKQKPTWYLEDDTSRREVTPDTHEWTSYNND